MRRKNLSVFFTPCFFAGKTISPTKILALNFVVKVTIRRKNPSKNRNTTQNPIFVATHFLGFCDAFRRVFVVIPTKYSVGESVIFVATNFFPTKKFRCFFYTKFLFGIGFYDAKNDFRRDEKNASQSRVSLKN